MATNKLRLCRTFCRQQIGKFGVKLALIYLIAVSIMHFSSYQHVNKISKIPRYTNNETVILFWTTFFETDDFEVGFGYQPFRHCPASCNNCRTTNDRSFFNRSNAVIFHIRDLNLEDMPNYRLPHQRWIFYLLESPVHTPTLIEDLRDQFNWTMTYRMDSDVQSPYGLSEEVIAEKRLIESHQKAARVFDRRLTRLLSNKNKQIAWVVSNCETTSGREHYVNELSKYINVDIYGQCGQNCTDEGLKCFETLGKQYKFYLSFENSFCRDYVTEKFYRPLLYNMVPIVYGSAVYSRIPELKSAYIDTRDFTSVQDLAIYLHYLDKNDEAYQRYFEWRRRPTGLSVLPRLHTPWCDLCEKLGRSSPKSFNSYYNIYAWWFDEANCDQDKKMFENQLNMTLTTTTTVPEIFEYVYNNNI